MTMLPVTVLSGFLGAGKTTVLNHLLHNTAGMRIAVIVNDMSEINVDARTVAANSMELSRSSERLVELSNGCICCTLREDLLEEVARLARRRKFDYLVIESTGISEPLPVAETFTFEDESGQSLGSMARLDTMVTVVDAVNFLDGLSSPDHLADREIGVDGEDTRQIADLLMDQVEFANVILLNKCDMVSERRRAELQSALRALNPGARVHAIDHGRIPPDAILNTGLFDLDVAAAQDGWLSQPRESMSSEVDEYGISSMVYRRRRPFHPARLWDLLNRASGPLLKVLRSKGIAWLASQNDTTLEWSHVGICVNLGPAGTWWAATPDTAWPDDAGLVEEARSVSEPPWGDRRQEIVLIGQHANWMSVVQDLDRCLLEDEELDGGPERWRTLADPFRDAAETDAGA